MKMTYEEQAERTAAAFQREIDRLEALPSEERKKAALANLVEIGLMNPDGTPTAPFARSPRESETVYVDWDDEASVYTAEDVGIDLSLKCKSFEELITLVKDVIPERLKDYGIEDCTSVYIHAEFTRKIDLV
jgi:hypothetical protein